MGRSEEGKRKDPSSGLFFPRYIPGIQRDPLLTVSGISARSSIIYIDTQVQAGDKGSEVHYTTDGSDPTKDSPLYQAPFAFAQKGTVKAIAYDPTFDTVSPVSAQTFDIPACDYTIVSPKDEKTSLILDGNGYTTYYLPQGKQELVVQLAKEMPISGFRYTPNQGRDASGHISNYQLYINGKKVAEANSPISRLTRSSKSYISQ